jgi:hypothetical protein
VNVAAASPDAVAVTVYSGPTYNTGLSTTLPSRRMRALTPVPARALDAIVDENELASTRIVKIDVEGGEDAVIDGMRSFVARCRRDVEIVIELSPTWWTNPARRPVDVLQPLVDAGFNVYEMSNNYWPWRYLWPRCLPSVRRCTRDLTRRVARLDLVLSRADAASL